MFRIIRAIITGRWNYEPKHQHEWEIEHEKKTEIVDQAYYDRNKEIVVGWERVVFFKCKTCGDIIMKRFKY